MEQIILEALGVYMLGFINISPWVFLVFTGVSRFLKNDRPSVESIFIFSMNISLVSTLLIYAEWYRYMVLLVLASFIGIYIYLRMIDVLFPSEQKSF